MEFPKSVHCFPTLFSLRVCFAFSPWLFHANPTLLFNWCFPIQECSPNELEDTLLARWLIGEDTSGEYGSGQWKGDRRRKFVDVICLGAGNTWLGLRPEEEEMSSESRREQ